METRRVKIDEYETQSIILNDGEYLLLYNSFSERYIEQQYSVHRRMIVLTNNEEFVGVFTCSQCMHETKKSLEELHKIMES